MNRNELLRGLLAGAGTWFSLLLLRTAMDAFACYEQGSYYRSKRKDVSVS